MLLLSTPKISLEGTLKNAKYCKENHALYVELITHLTMHLRIHLVISIKMHKRVYVRLH